MLSGFRLVLRRVPEDRLILAIPVWFRLLLLAFGLIILFALLATSENGTRGVVAAGNTLPLILGALSFLGAAYSERWVFDRSLDRLEYEAGILIFGLRRAWSLSQLKEVEVGQFIRGRPHAPAATQPGLFARPLITLALHSREGDSHRLEFYSYSQRSRVREYALAIASYCDIALIDKSTDAG